MNLVPVVPKNGVSDTKIGYTAIVFWHQSHDVIPVVSYFLPWCQRYGELAPKKLVQTYAKSMYAYRTCYVFFVMHPKKRLIRSFNLPYIQEKSYDVASRRTVLILFRSDNSYRCCITGFCNHTIPCANGVRYRVCLSYD